MAMPRRKSRWLTWPWPSSMSWSARKTCASALPSATKPHINEENPMQLNASAYVATDTPARYISRLCKHFAHKLPVSFDEQQGRIEFDSGLALLQAEAEGLRLSVQSASSEGLESLKKVVTSHFERVAWQAELSLDWQ